MKRAIPLVTIASKNYAAHVRVLARSYREFHPDAAVYLCLVDRPEGASPFGEDEPFETIPAHALGIEPWSHFSFKYDITELNTAVKPYILRYLFEKQGFEKLLYLDPDILVLDALDEIPNLLDQHGVILTPHVVVPSLSEPTSLELITSRTGTYNLGFLGLSNRYALRELLEWWSARLYRYCRVDLERGLFVDQRWMDLVPGLFEGVHVVRDPSWNVAWWNFRERRVAARGGQFLVGEKPMKFAHFSGFRADQPNRLTRYHPDGDVGAFGEVVADLYAEYLKRLHANGFAEATQHAYSYECFGDGTPIPDAARVYCMEADPFGERWPDPFAVGPGSFHAHWTATRRKIRRGLGAGLGMGWNLSRKWLRKALD